MLNVIFIYNGKPLLNYKTPRVGPITKPAYRRRGHHPVVQEKVGTPQEQTPQTAGVPDASSSASASASASAGAAADSGADGAGSHPPQNHGPVVVQKRVNYDEIFNVSLTIG